METGQIKIVAFDLDDTLYDERSFVESGFRAVAAYIQKLHGVPVGDFFQLLSAILDEKGRGHIFDHALRKYNIYSSALVKDLVKLYRDHKPSIILKREAMDVLHDLKKSYKLTLITDGITSVQKNKVKVLGLADVFDAIIYTDDLGLSKPDPVVFKKMVSLFSVDPHMAVYIGDNPYKDFIGAKQAGLATVRLLQGIYEDTYLSKEYEAHYQIYHLQELTDIFKEKS